ncbi:hypothetical protein [Acinetobacter sp. YH12045]|uniref:hypothetical protein n=1 Tax=Acinetobacter sp. YH12045 TaxID=2601051 RepID=UPI0015D179F9|nr:hypothetical protein [Acinetobacter sp. YH12045]
MNKHIETIKLFGISLKSAVIENTETTVDSIQLIGKGLLGLLMVLGDYAVRLTFPVLIIFALPLVTWLRIKGECALEKARKEAVKEYMDSMTCLHQKDGADDQHLPR